MATKVLTAPWTKDGSLLHFPGDGRRFSHYESLTGERLEPSDIWEDLPAPENLSRYHSHTVRRYLREDWRQVNTEPDWRPNEPFHASLQIKHMLTGMSAKYVILGPVNMPTDRRTYPMFISDLIDYSIRVGIQRGGIMSGRWMVSKRGQNYGLRAAKEGE